MVLATLTGLAPLATDMYVPGLPELTRSLDTRPSAAQLTMTAFLIGVVVGQLVLGPVSDAVGRRPVLLAGTALFTAFSVVCAAAPTIEVLNAARLCQGIAGAAGIVVARAVITDVADGVAAARKFATLGAISAAAPILAPMLGGVVLNLATWRAVFVVLAAIGALQILAVLVWVPESLPPSRRAPAKPAATLTAMTTLIRRRELLAHVLSLCFGGAAVFVYIAGSTFVFQEIHGASTTLTSVIYGVNALGTMTGSVLFGRLVDRFGVTRLLITGLTTALAASAVLAALLTFTAGTLIVTWACLFTMITAFGMFFPAVTTAAQSTGRDAPGATSALLGAGQFLLGGVISPLVGVFGTSSALPMALLTTACLAASLLVVGCRTRASTRPLCKETYQRKVH
nr:Multidrug resistance transporter, Bcr/CflA family [Kibdelosporangium sp. MJ126-NF4]